MPTQRERNAIQSSDRIAFVQFQRYAIRLAFDGTTYQGFQAQPFKNTIQDQIEHRLRGLLRRKVRIIAWGRTDSGVHAQGAVVTVDISLDEVRKFAKRCTNKSSTAATEEEESDQIKAARFLCSVLKEFACNSGDTPQPQTRYGSISCRTIVPVPSDFDARYSSLWKRYVYYICAGENGDQLPFVWTRYVWHIKKSLDFHAMFDAAELLSRQEHNFEWMCLMQPGELRNPRRKVNLKMEKIPINTDADNAPYFLQQNGNTVVYKITAECDFFLYKMMRRIVGILVALGKHDAGIDMLKTCLDEYDNANSNDPDRREIKVPDNLLQTAPAKGLCLEHIEYDIAI